MRRVPVRYYRSAQVDRADIRPIAADDAQFDTRDFDIKDAQETGVDTERFGRRWNFRRWEGGDMAAVYALGAIVIAALICAGIWRVDWDEDGKDLPEDEDDERHW